MADYKAALLDAVDTLWYTPVSPNEVWRGILTDLGFDLPTEEIDRAWKEEWKILEPEGLSFESSGRPNSPSDIDSMFKSSEGRMTERLGLKVDADRFRRVAPQYFMKTAVLYPETADVLKELGRMSIKVAMVSNGVYQHRTAQWLGIDTCFDSIFGSLHVGFAKPAPEIFQMALSSLSIGPSEAVMVGDNWEADVLGARNVGIRGVHLIRLDEAPSGLDTITDLKGVIDTLATRTL